MAAEPSPWRPLLSLAGVGMTLVIATVGATVGGYFVDRWLGSTPWFPLIGLAVGIAAGLGNFVRTLRRAARQEHDDGLDLVGRVSRAVMALARAPHPGRRLCSPAGPARSACWPAALSPLGELPLDRARVVRSSAKLVAGGAGAPVVGAGPGAALCPAPRRARPLLGDGVVHPMALAGRLSIRAPRAARHQGLRAARAPDRERTMDVIEHPPIISLARAFPTTSSTRGSSWAS